MNQVRIEEVKNTFPDVIVETLIFSVKFHSYTRLDGAGTRCRPIKRSFSKNHLQHMKNVVKYKTKIEDFAIITVRSY